MLKWEWQTDVAARSLFANGIATVKSQVVAVQMPNTFLASG